MERNFNGVTVLKGDRISAVNVLTGCLYKLGDRINVVNALAEYEREGTC